MQYYYLPSIVSPQTDQHDTCLSHFTISLKLHLGLLRLYDIALNNGGVVAKRCIIEIVSQIKVEFDEWNASPSGHRLYNAQQSNTHNHRHCNSINNRVVTKCWWMPYSIHSGIWSAVTFQTKAQ
jgi:hypothetical protein